MQNFKYFTPTKVHFGTDAEKEVCAQIKNSGYKKVLLHYGGGSIKNTGLYDILTKGLQEAGVAWLELGGVEPNPKIRLIRQGVELCRKEGVDFILAAGGGSVADSAKAIALGTANNCDPWDVILKKVTPETTLPVGVVLTLAAAGSEMSNSMVITNPEGLLKRGFNDDMIRPVLAFMNPKLTFTVSKYQTACGIVDIMMHTLERYFMPGKDTHLTDKLAEGLLVSVKEAGKIAMNNPEDYEARATLMWASSLSHNGLTGCGRQFMLPVHQLEHDLSGMFDRIAHGAGLAVLFPAWAKYVYKKNIERFCQIAVNVWNVEMNFEYPERTALEGIEAMQDYFKSLGMPATLREFDVDESSFEEMAEKCTFFGKRKIPSIVELGKQEILDIFQMAK